MRIANEYLDQLVQADLGRRDLKVIFAVIRETWGWGRKTAPMSHSRLGRLTGVYRSHVAAALQELIRRRFLIRTKTGDLGPQKDYELWLPVSVDRPATSRTMVRNVPRYETAPNPGTNRLHALVRDVPPSKTKKDRKPKAAAVSPAAPVPVKELLAEYDRLHLEHAREKPFITAADAALAAKLLKRYGADKASGLLRYFYEHRPRWAREQNRYDFKAFTASIETLIGMQRDGV